MRRLPQESPALLRQPPPTGAVQGATSLRLSLPLRLITPQVGGGVEPHLPDDETPVRLSGVRGQLRQWWRWLFLEHKFDQRPANAHRDEVTLWGGVLGDTAFASRVRLRVEGVSPGVVKAAGHHKLNQNGQPRSMPSYSGDAVGLDYALFPLQAPKEQLQGQSAEVPTKPIRTGLSFTLVVEVDPRAERADQDLTEVLAALWAWTQLGGLGARTRRGLGAVALSAPATRLPGAAFPSGGLPWDRLFRPMSAGDWRALAPQVLRVGAVGAGSRASRSELWVGTPATTVAGAHRALVEALKTFRQGRNVGRAPGDERPGQSYWPEGNVLRATRDTLHPRPPAWKHPPGADATRDLALPLDRRTMGAPRAAFGLPLEVQFKDEQDKPASASVLPAAEGRDRLASPLLLRPVQVTEGALPVLLKLPLEQPSGPFLVRLKFKDNSGVSLSPVRLPGGAHAPVAGLLQRRKGNAVNAFLDWMQSTSNFQRIP